MKTIIMKTAIIISLLVSIPFMGQNTFPSSGNVGIGTLNPSHRLDINTGAGHLKTYSFGLEHTVNTTGGWARGFRLRNEYDNKTTVFGSLNGTAYISTGFSINTDATGYRNQKFTILTNGNVGIGTTNPSHRLDINVGGSHLKTYDLGLEHTVNGTGNWTRGFRLRNEYDNKTTVFGSYNGAAYISTGFNVDSDATGYRSQKITVLTNGKVGIGTTIPDEKLTVNGKIHAKEVRVDLAIPADYVFQQYYTGNSSLKDNYTMPTLEEVAAFTKKNHHLPAIPSASQIQKEGLHLKQMTNLLLQKIEELTIYTIEQEERMKSQEERIKTLEKKLVAKKS